MGVSNRGPQGIPANRFSGRFDYLTSATLDPQGAWASQTMTASGVFVAPTANVMLNKHRKVDVYLTGIAGGGPGGTISGSPSTGAQWSEGGGGQSGYFTIRYKVSLYPGERVNVIIPGQTSAGSNGGSLVFGTYLTLTGGSKGRNGGPSISQATALPPTPGSFAGFAIKTGGALSSGNPSTDNAIYTGLSGNHGEFFNQYNQDALTNPAEAGQDVSFLTGYYGGKVATAYGGAGGLAPGWTKYGGGGGAGLFGNGGNGSTSTGADADANSGGGGGGTGGNGANANSGKGAAGQLLIEWRIPA